MRGKWPQRRWRELISISIVVLLSGRNGAAQTNRGSREIRPVFAQATLRIGDQELKPVRVQRPVRPEFWVGGRRFVVSRTHVDEVDAVTGKERWTRSPADAMQLRWLAAHGDVAYLLAEPDPLRPNIPPDRNTDVSVGQLPRTSIRRLDLRTEDWLSPLSSNELRLGTDPECALVSDRSLIVLGAAASAVVKEHANDQKQKTYAIACFRDGKDHALWTKTFSVTGANERARPGVALWSATRPDFANSNIQPLSWLGDDVLVCAGELQDLFCLDGADGHVKWRLPRVWEFERSFIGPSVWNHVITRFGLDHDIEGTARGEVQFADPSQQKPEEEKANRLLTDAARRVEEQTEAAIVGGPVVVTKMGHDDRWATRHIFVAVAKGPKGLWSGFLADCVLYELNEDGQPRALCKLPRTVLGRRFRSLPGGLVWCTQRGGAARVQLRTASGFFGPGGDDALCEIEWYKEFRPVSRNVWLVADPINDVVAFSGQHLFRCISGGYVRSVDEAIYRFPITEIDLSTGASRDWELSVPLQKQLDLPSTNVSKVDSGWHAAGSWLMAVTRLEVDDAEGILKVVLGLEDSSAALEFSLNAGPPN